MRCAWWVIFGSVTFCASAGCSSDDDASSPPNDQARYQAAIEDAKLAEAGEIVNTLVAIRPDNAELIRDGADRILMATWTSFTGYDAKIDQSMDLAVEVWLTVAPQVGRFCQRTGLSGDALSLRIAQLLGLPPGGGENRMVELWIPQDAMFRPTPDPEITDATAALDFPPNTPQAHIDWINDLRAQSYGADGYPWTRLGYTYDWKVDPTEVGVSEFVVRKGSTVVVKSVTPTDDYCKPKS